ncbi:uncharacterized protein [Solanum lycopersicum]|uniref:uncharacterized protein n=1 Tax=Solanum lycopersicum TaxID=4081 RepID=UPI003747FA3E
MLRACVLEFGGQSPMGWFESTEPRSQGTELIQEALEQVRVIQDRFRIALIRHQRYADRRRGPLRFSVGDRLFLHVSPMKGVMRFGRLAIHMVFHVSMLRRYILDESRVLQYDAVELDDRLTFVEEPVAILTRDVRKLRLRSIPIFNIRWRHRLVEEATWETKQKM